MVKIVLLLITFAISIFECFITPVNEIYFQILLFLAYSIANLLLIIILFFIISFIIGLPINTKKKNHHYNKFYRHVLVLATRICLSLFSVKVTKKGLEKIPQDTNFLLTFNHRSNLDSMIIDVILKDIPLVFIAKKSLFKIPFFGKMLHAIGYIKLDRSHLRQEYIAICDGIDLLNSNECSIGISPEGTRNFTEEKLLPFKAGCFRLATKSKKPIVVTILKNTKEIKKHLLIKRHKVSFEVLDVLYFEDYKDLNNYEIADKVQEIMLKSLNED